MHVLVCVPDIVMEREEIKRMLYRGNGDRQKVKRQNELVFVVFSFSCTMPHPHLADGYSMKPY